jgi:NADH dehydrogenase (ubiquinone) 1 alpha subcomplex subunit 9
MGAAEVGLSARSGIVATVFGSTGFTGRYVVECLARVGAQIVIPFRGEEKSYNHLKVIGDLGQVVPLRFDVRDMESIKRTVSHSNVVINLIGRFWETRNFSYHDVHVKAATAIAEASQHVDRFIHVSAACISPSSPTAFARTKAEGEAKVKEILPWATILRPTIMFGDEDRLLNKWGGIAAYWPINPIFSHNKKIQPLYGIDLAKAVIGALGDAESIGKTYVLGGPQVFTWEELINRILEGTKRNMRKIDLSAQTMEKISRWLQYLPDPTFIPDEVKHYDQDVLVAEGELGIEKLGVKPTTRIDYSLARVTRAYRHPTRFSEITEATPPI